MLLGKKQNEEKSTKRFSSGSKKTLQRNTMTRGYRGCEYENIRGLYMAYAVHQVIEYRWEIRNNEHGEQRQTPESTLSVHNLNDEVCR